MEVKMKNFVADFTEKDIEDFICCPVEELRKNDNGGYVKFFTGSYGPSPEFKYDSFTFKGINSYANSDYSSDWRKHVAKKLSPVDKKEYIDEFNNSLDCQKMSID